MIVFLEGLSGLSKAKLEDSHLFVKVTVLADA